MLQPFLQILCIVRSEIGSATVHRGCQKERDIVLVSQCLVLTHQVLKSLDGVTLQCAPGSSALIKQGSQLLIAMPSNRDKPGAFPQ